jgi:hypothetical protein
VCCNGFTYFRCAFFRNLQQLEGVTGEDRRKLKKKLKLKRKKQQGRKVVTEQPLPTAAAAPSGTKFVLCSSGQAEETIATNVDELWYVTAPDGGIGWFDSVTDATVYAKLREFSLASVTSRDGSQDDAPDTPAKPEGVELLGTLQQTLQPCQPYLLLVLLALSPCPHLL